MLSSKKLVDDTGEKAFSGYDVKFSGQVHLGSFYGCL
jgi:hypothetical protein